MSVSALRLQNVLDINNVQYYSILSHLSLYQHSESPGEKRHQNGTGFAEIQSVEILAPQNGITRP